MTNVFNQLNQAARWNLLVQAAKMGAESNNYAMQRKPGRGLSNTWLMTRNGKTQSAAVRTSRDRYIAFPPLKGGSTWKTLDSVELVLVGVVNDVENPTSIVVYLFDAGEVRKRFNAAYQARIDAGHVVPDDYGMWVKLEHDQRQLPVAVGSGLADDFKPIAEFKIADMLALAPPKSQPEPVEEELNPTDDSPTTVGDVIARACDDIARIAGVPRDNVKLELKIQY
jgi:hypothetical protein